MFILYLLTNLFSKTKWYDNPFTLSFGGSGGGEDPPPAPTPPSASETTREAIAAQVESLPDILAAQTEFGPQFTQLQLDQLKQFGGQFAQAGLDLQNEFGPRMATALREEQRALAPELGAAQDTLQQYLEQPDELTPEEQRQFEQDSRAAQNVRGFGIASGEGAKAELKQLTQLRQELKTRRINVALSTAGRVPITGGSQVPAQQFGPGQLVENVKPSDIFGLAASNFSSQASIFGSQAGLAGQNSANAAAQRGQNMQMAGSIAATVGTVAIAI